VQLLSAGGKFMGFSLHGMEMIFCGFCSAQMLLRIGSLKTLLTMSKAELLEKSTSLPNKVILVIMTTVTQEVLLVF